MERPPPKFVAFLAQLVTCSWMAHASAEPDVPWLEYAPPPECPGEEAIGRRVEEWLGRPGVPEGLSVEASLDWAGDVWEVRVSVRQEGESGVRRVQVPSCSDAADFVALAVVLAVDPSLVPEEAPPPSAGPATEPSPSSSASETVAEPALVEEQPVVDEQPTEANGSGERAPPVERTRIALVTRAAGMVQGGHFEGAQGGISLGTGIAWRPLQVEAVGSLFPPHKYRFSEARNDLNYSQWSVGLRGCLTLGKSEWTILPCLQGEVQRLRLAEIQSGGSTGRWNFLAGLGLFGRFGLADVLYPYGGARFALPVDRTVFRVDRGEILHRFSYSIQGEVGVQVFLGSQ